MRVLITGAGGFAGSAVRAAVTRKGWASLGVGRRAAPGVTALDLGAPEAAQRLEAVGRIDAVAHFSTHVDFRAEATDAEFFASGPLATATLASFAHRQGAYFLFASATMVLGQRTRHTDASTPAPDHAYARSKLLCEQIIAAAGLRHSILRIGGIFGRRGPQHLGLNRAIDAAIDQRQPPVVVGGGLGRRNYIFVHDLADAVVHCIESEVEGVHLAAGAETLSVREMMHHLCSALLPGGKPRFQEGPEAQDMVVEPSRSLPAGRSFRAALGAIATDASVVRA